MKSNSSSENDKTLEKLQNLREIAELAEEMTKKFNKCEELNKIKCAYSEKEHRSCDCTCERCKAKTKAGKELHEAMKKIINHK